MELVREETVLVILLSKSIRLFELYFILSRHKSSKTVVPTFPHAEILSFVPSVKLRFNLSLRENCWFFFCVLSRPFKILCNAFSLAVKRMVLNVEGLLRHSHQNFVWITAFEAFVQLSAESSETNAQSILMSQSRETSDCSQL